MQRPLVPVTLLTGWLGAGKTTLLNHILANAGGIRAAVIVNDIGEVNIDAELIAKGGAVSLDDSLVALQNGCICCSLKEDLLQQILDLVASGRFDRIIIEASGICDPLPIAQAIASGDIMPRVCRIDGIVTVVDALRMADEFLGGRTLLDGPEEDDPATLLVKQIEFCSTIVLNKAGEVPADQLAVLREVIRQLQPAARLFQTDYARVDVGTLLGGESFDFARVGRSAGWIRTMQRYDELQAAGLTMDGADHSHCDHEHGVCHCGHSHGEACGISSFVYVRRPGIDPERFAEFMEKGWPANVIRCKGIVWFTDDRTMSYLFEQAGRQVTAKQFGRWLAAASREEQTAARTADAELDAAWDETYGDRMIKLVFIGKDMDRDAICDALDDCLEA